VQISHQASASASHNKLPLLELTGLPRLRAAASVEVTFDIDANGHRDVTARTRAPARETIKTPGGSAFQGETTDDQGRRAHAEKTARVAEEADVRTRPRRWLQTEKFVKEQREARAFAGSRGTLNKVDAAVLRTKTGTRWHDISPIQAADGNGPGVQPGQAILRSHPAAGCRWLPSPEARGSADGCCDRGVSR